VDKLIFQKIDSDQIPIQEITGFLKLHTKTSKVLLLLSGGSAIPLQMQILSSFKSSKNLDLCLNDERYGPVGHKDSNWRQLEIAGLNDLNLTGFVILGGKDLAGTTKDFNDFLKAARHKYQVIVSILGMGADGHTSGILPGSPAIASADYVSSYKWTDYTRITNTFKMLRQIDQAYVYARGESKHPQLKKLSRDLDITKQPIQIVKQLKSVTFYNDYKGE